MSPYTVINYLIIL